jgi:hypothetical protein
MADEKAARTLDEQIAQALRAAEESGELRLAKHYGRPIDFGDGYADTPPELRMAFKILKDANCPPAEVEMLKQAETMRANLARLEPGSDEAAALRVKIRDLELEIALRIERLSARRL